MPVTGRKSRHRSDRGKPLTYDTPCSPLKTITSLCEGCGLVVFPDETCAQCSGGAGRWLRYWLPGIECR